MRRSAFTLVELLIVVVILAILAAVIPLFSDSTADARNSAALANLHTVRHQIEFYRAQPAAEDRYHRRPASDFGPYLPALPINPFTNKITVRATNSNPPTTVSSGPDRGWPYHAASGGAWLDQEGYLTK